MGLIEGFLKWSMVAVVGLMLLSGIGSAVFAGAMGLMNDPVVIAVVAVGFFLFVGLICIPLVLMVAWIWRWWRMSAIRESQAREFIAPDEGGRLPLPTSLLRTQAGAQLAFGQNVASFTNNLHTFNYQPSQTITGADGQTLSAAATATPGTFWQLYETGALPDNGFLMGYDTINGDPVVANWKQLYSALVGGMSGSGKSTIVRLLLAQAALQRGKFVVVDPHFGSGDESLGASLMAFRGLMVCDVASDEQQIVDALRWVADTGRRRLQGLDADRTPLVLIVDETPGLLEGGYGDNAQAQLLQTLNLVVRETRKVGVFAFAIGQTFQADTMPSKIRNSFASMVGCAMRRDEARYMSGNSRFAQAVDELTGYQAVWMNPQREVITLTVPNCTQNDVELVAGRVLGANVEPVTQNTTLPPVKSRSTSRSDDRSTSRSDVDFNNLDDTYLERHFPKSRTATELVLELANDDRANRAISMFLAGKSNGEIAAELWGATTGDKKVKALQELSNILRSHIMRLGGNN